MLSHAIIFSHIHSYSTWRLLPGLSLPQMCHQSTINLLQSICNEYGTARLQLLTAAPGGAVRAGAPPYDSELEAEERTLPTVAAEPDGSILIRCRLCQRWRTESAASDAINLPSICHQSAINLPSICDQYATNLQLICVLKVRQSRSACAPAAAGTAGLWALFVLLDGEPIGDSPFAIEVEPAQ